MLGHVLAFGQDISLLGHVLAFGLEISEIMLYFTSRGGVKDRNLASGLYLYFTCLGHLFGLGIFHANCQGGFSV